MNTLVKSDRIPLGIILILTSTFLVALQEAAIKEVSTSISLWQLYVVRSLTLIPVLMALGMYWGDGLSTLRNALRFWSMVRSILFMCMYFSAYAVIQHVPLAIIAAGIYTAPLFVVLITTISGLEPAKPIRWPAIVIGFIGVMLILKPGAASFNWLTIIPIIGGIFYAFVGIVTRTKCQNTPAPTLAVSLSIGLLIVGGVMSMLIAVFGTAHTPSAGTAFLIGNWGHLGTTEWIMILALAALMFGNGLVLPIAYQIAPTTIIATFDYSYLIFATLIGYLFFAEIPDAISIAGMLLIVGAGAIIARS